MGPWATLTESSTVADTLQALSVGSALPNVGSLIDLMLMLILVNK